MLEIPQDYNVTTTKTSLIIRRTTAPTYYSGKDKERYGTLLQNNFQNIQLSWKWMNEFLKWKKIFLTILNQRECRRGYLYTQFVLNLIQCAQEHTLMIQVHWLVELLFWNYSLTMICPIQLLRPAKKPMAGPSSCMGQIMVRV